MSRLKKIHADLHSISGNLDTTLNSLQTTFQTIETSRNSLSQEILDVVSQTAMDVATGDQALKDMFTDLSNCANEIKNISLEMEPYERAVNIINSIKQYVQALPQAPQYQ